MITFQVIWVNHSVDCRPGCGACCIAPSISSFVPGMPKGKPAGVRCINLTNSNFCQLFLDETRPKICAKFTADADMCGNNNQEALVNLQKLEHLTSECSSEFERLPFPTYTYI